MEAALDGIDLRVGGMTCPHWPPAIEKAIRSVAGGSAGYRVAEPKVPATSETLDPAEAANEEEYRTLTRKFSFFKPRTGRDWCSFSAFLVALFAEMYGFPLTIYFLSGWLQSRFPNVDWFSHDAGHLLEMTFG